MKRGSPVAIFLCFPFLYRVHVHTCDVVACFFFSEDLSALFLHIIIIIMSNGSGERGTQMHVL